MIDLSKTSGLPISLDEDNMLIVPHTLMVKEMIERRAKDMAPFLISPEAIANTDPIYRVYRDLLPMESDSNPELEYDITVILAGTFQFPNGDREYFRTAGHYHDASKNRIGYPEIYEVLSGYGRWVIQKKAGSDEEITESYLIEAGPGEKVCIPPGFGHITVNAENSPLVEANIRAHFDYDYESYKKTGGGVWRILASNESGMLEIESNPNYRETSHLKKLRPRKDWFKGYFDPLWNVYQNSPKDVAFLVHPEEYHQEFFLIKNLYQEI